MADDSDESDHSKDKRPVDDYKSIKKEMKSGTSTGGHKDAKHDSNAQRLYPDLDADEKSSQKDADRRKARTKSPSKFS